ncbi:MAG: alpha/beta hydrolase [Rhodospirillales bacterium]|nr:alpha/beta hydrolase [Rhodospirillales bacterium]
MTLYHGYDRAGLDGQYNNRLLVPNYAEHFARWKAGTEAANARFKGTARYDVAYGPEKLENLDIYPAKASGGTKPPILVFIHGGYWRLLDKSDFAFTAPAYVDAGITYIPINYTLIPALTIDDIVRQVRAAIAWLYRNPDAHGGDLTRLYVSGHSAGGQLAPMALVHDWRAEGLPADLVKGAVAISGLHDLEAMRRCYLNEGMNLDDGMVRRNSPIHQIPPASRPMPPLLLSVGALESAEFQRQQADYAAAWAKSQKPATIVPAPGANHFSVIEQFADPSTALFRATRDLVLGR